MAGGYIKVKGGSGGRRDGDQRPRRLRRGRRCRSRLPAGGHVGGHGLHGGARRRSVSRSARLRCGLVTLMCSQANADGQTRATSKKLARRGAREGARRRRRLAHPRLQRRPHRDSRRSAGMPRKHARRRYRSRREHLPMCASCPPSTRVKHASPRPAPIARQRIADERDALAASKYGAEPAPKRGTSARRSKREQTFLRKGSARDILRKLRRGQWSVQASIDLHGHTIDEAHDALADFLDEARQRGYRCVRVIHGKGLTSPNREPVLKGKVRRWLAQLGRRARLLRSAAECRRRRRGAGAACAAAERCRPFVRRRQRRGSSPSSAQVELVALIEVVSIIVRTIPRSGLERDGLRPP